MYLSNYPAGVRASSLREICESLQVEMVGTEHCGLDDSYMVLLLDFIRTTLGTQRHLRQDLAFNHQGWRSSNY